MRLRSDASPITPLDGTVTAPRWDAPLPPMVARFLARLRRVPLGAWADAARRMDDGWRGASRHEITPRGRLRQVVDGIPHIAPRVRGRVLDVTSAAEGFVPAEQVERMKTAALAAALALAARRELGEEQFARLYAPFASLIPLSELAEEIGSVADLHDGRRAVLATASGA